MLGKMVHLLLYHVCPRIIETNKGWPERDKSCLPVSVYHHQPGQPVQVTKSILVNREVSCTLSRNKIMQISLIVLQGTGRTVKQVLDERFL